MRIAFVGVKRKYQELRPDYRDAFNRFHLELPYYYAQDGGNQVLITTVDYQDNACFFSPAVSDVGTGYGALRCDTEENFKIKGSSYSDTRYDVVVHWRKWFPELYRPEAINVINCQDHSFSDEWLDSVRNARSEGKLYGILCFPGWHKRNLIRELGARGSFPPDRLFDGVTLGVDTDVYRPLPGKDPYQMLWASDPGRGVGAAFELAVRLFKINRKFKLHVCWPDYSSAVSVSHPALKFHRNLDNGPELWDLFGSTGILPYTSGFMEPSSRAHRQAMAAGSLVLYPPGMGTPSELIEDGVTGLVRPVEEWAGHIMQSIHDGTCQTLGRQAREYAISENWAVQARRFNDLFGKMLEERK